MDELKKYLQNHADELNLDEPRLQVWQNIRQETVGNKKPAAIIMFTRWVIAACVLLLAGIGTWYVLRDKKPNTLISETKVQKRIVAPAPVQNETATVETPISNAISKTKITAKFHKPVNPLPPINSIEELTALSGVENSFTQVINLQRERVSAMPMYAETPEYFNDFKVQIKQMEKDEKVIKSDIARHGMNNELLDQLINLYQQKLGILKQLQIEMNKTNNRYKQNHVPVDSARTYFLNM